ncbi:MAG TPA: acyltransferase [Pyrinomonadaceae bacterium]|nr:acyltransferase [Pyrinomonadaceae bacterium]
MPATDSHRAGSFYRPELDCLRFIAFLFVFVSHAFAIDIGYYTYQGMPHEAALWLCRAVAVGGFGVALFFVLSSYLITELLIREHDRTGRLDIKSFYIRRALRIWPLYFFFLLLIYFAIPQQSIYALKGTFLAAMLLFAGNWACVFLGGMGYSVAGPLWSVSVEEQFYLAWPLIVSRIGIKNLKTVCLIVIVIANLTRIIMEKKGAGFVAFWCNTISWFDAIAAGALIALLLRGGTPKLSRLQRVLLFAGGFAVWVLPARFSQFLIYPDIASYPLIVSGSVMMLLSFLGSGIANPVLVYLGRISYGLYVWHVLALAIVSNVLRKYHPLHALSGFALTILISSISYRLLEQPFLKLKKRFTYIVSRPVEATAGMDLPAVEKST